MGYGRYIGRIGALAVALGIGAAVGTGGGLPTAFADGGTDGTTTTNTSDTTGNGPTTTDTTTDTKTSPTVDAETPTTPALPPAEGTSATPGGSDGSGPVVVVGDGRNGTTPSSPTQTPPPSTPETPPPPPPTTATPPPPLASPEQEDHGAKSTPPSAQHQKTVAPATETPSGPNTPPPGPQPPAGIDLQVTSSLAHAVSPIQARVAASTPDIPAASAQQVLPAALSAPVPAPAPQMNIISAVLSAFGFTPLLAPGPAAPAATPGIWTLLAWARREIEQTFFNHTPTLKPTQNSLIVDENGEITGSLGASDPDEGETEGLTFRLVQDGAHGHVVIHDDGTWTYTANEGYSGPDSFKVITSDADTGWHVHGLLQTLFSPNGGATQAATVNLVALQSANVVGSPLRLGGEPIGSPVFSPDGKTGWQLARPAGTAEGYRLVMFDMATGHFRSSVTTGAGVPTDEGLVLSADGTRAFFVMQRGDDATDVNIVALDGPPDIPDTVSIVGKLVNPGDVVLSADGKRIYVTTREIGERYDRTHVSVVDLSGESLVAERSAFGTSSGPVLETASGRIVQVVVMESSTPSNAATSVILLDSHTGQPVGDPLHFGGAIPRGQLILDATGTRAMLRLDPVDPVVGGDMLIFVNLTNGTVAHPVSIQSDATARFVGDGSTVQLVTLVAATPLHDASYYVSVLDTASGASLGSTNLHFNSLQAPAATYADDGTGYYVAPLSDHTEVYAIGPDGTSRVFVVDGSYIRGAIFQPTRSAIVLNADQSRLYVTTVTGPDDATTLLTAINVATGTSSSVQLDGSLNSPMVTNEQHSRAIVFTHTPGVTNETGAYATVIDLVTGQPVGSPMKLAADGVNSFPRATFTADGNKAYVVVNNSSITPGQGTTTLTAIDLVTGQAIGATIVDGDPADFIDGPAPGLVLGADGTKGFLVTERLLSDGSSHELVVTGLDLTRASVIAVPVVLAGPGDAPRFTVNEAGTLAVFLRKGSNTLFDLNGHSVKVTSRDSSGIVYTTFSEDGNAAYMRASTYLNGEESTGITTVIRTPSGDLTTLQLELPDYAAGDLNFSPDGARAVLETRAGADRFLQILDLGAATTLPDVEVPESVVPINPAQALREWIEHIFFI